MSHHSEFDKITRLVGRAVAEFDMIHAGDRIAVGLSGGKDSTTLLHALLELQRHSPVRFELEAFTIEQGKFMGPLDGLKKHLSEINVAWRLLADSPSIKLVEDGIPHGCDLCSRYRRRAVYELVQKMNCNVIAFGHTADDFAEAMLRNMLFTGAVKPLPPTAISSGGEFRIVRPLIYVSENLIRGYAGEAAFPITPCACSLKEGARTKVRSFLHSLAAENPHIYSNLITAGVKTWRAGKAKTPEVSLEDLENSPALVEIR